MASKKDISELKAEIKALKDDAREERISDLGKVFDQLINRDMKSYEDNFRLIGLKYEIKDAQKDGDDAKDAFINRVLNVFVASKIVAAEKFFFIDGKEKGKLRPGVLRNLHPLSQRDNAPIVVAFLQSWMTARIKQRLQSGAGIIDGIKIFAHYPPIIEALKNEAMKERRRLLDADSVNQRVVVQVQFKKLWVILLKMSGRDKRERKALPFPVDDSRLVDPGRTLANLALADQEFVPKAFLDDEDKIAISAGEYAAGEVPQRRSRNAMDTK